MTNVALAKELFNTSMLLQDLYANIRRKDSEIELMKAAHEEEISAITKKLENFKSQSLLMQMLMQTSLQPTADEDHNSDEYRV